MTDFVKSNRRVFQRITIRLSLNFPWWERVTQTSIKKTTDRPDIVKNVPIHRK